MFTVLEFKFFAKLVVICSLIKPLFSNNTHEVNTFSIYVREETFVSGKFHKQLGFLAQVYYFTNFREFANVLVAILQKFTFNFRFKFSRQKGPLFIRR